MWDFGYSKLKTFCHNIRISGLRCYQPGNAMARRIKQEVTIDKVSTEFNRNLIIPDSTFLYTPNDFSTQAFLKKRGSVLAKMKFDGQWAADIIDEASKFISARVILTTLEKEYRLIRANQWEIDKHKGACFDWATGYSCDDRGRRNDAVRGFENQVLLGMANMRSRYDNDAERFVGKDISKSFIAKYGQVRDGVVIPGNKATAVLYIYTPWIGERDWICGGEAYKKPFANYYFWVLWNIFFGAER